MPRRKRDGLPPCVYRKHGAYYLVKRNKWTRLGSTLAEMYAALAQMEHERVRTLSELLRRYEREVIPTKAPATRRDQRRQLTRLKAVFGHMPPTDLKPAHVAQYLDRRGGVKANREVALLSHIYRKAIRWGLADTNPCTGVERNKEAPRTRYVDDAEFWTRWQQMSEPLQLCMELLYLTGQRLGDVLAIRESQISQEGIAVAQGKTGTRLILAWTPLLEDVVDRCRRRPTDEEDPPLLRNNAGKAYTVAGIGAMWRKVPWNGEPFQLRDLRAKSASDHESGAHLGHQSDGVLRRFYERKAKVVRGL